MKYSEFRCKLYRLWTENFELQKIGHKQDKVNISKHLDRFIFRGSTHTINRCESYELTSGS